MPERPAGRIGLYDPAYEHDACGVAMVAKLDGVASHETVDRAIVALENLEHRGAGRGSVIAVNARLRCCRTVRGDAPLDSDIARRDFEPRDVESATDGEEHSHGQILRLRPAPHGTAAPCWALWGRRSQR